jgi:hypothetical protein
MFNVFSDSINTCTIRNVSQQGQQPHQPQQRNASPQRNREPNLGFYNWQSTKMTVKERLTFLFNNTILSDVTFVVGRDNQQQRIPAHRFVLSGRLKSRGRKNTNYMGRLITVGLLIKVACFVKK